MNWRGLRAKAVAVAAGQADILRINGDGSVPEDAPRWGIAVGTAPLLSTMDDRVRRQAPVIKL